ELNSAFQTPAIIGPVAGVFSCADRLAKVSTPQSRQVYRRARIGDL
ncbi:MAG: hypothetical protein ACI8P0_006343, partial [Planctomycetaceae bacterium]